SRYQSRSQALSPRRTHALGPWRCSLWFQSISPRLALRRWGAQRSAWAYSVRQGWSSLTEDPSETPVEIPRIFYGRMGEVSGRVGKLQKELLRGKSVDALDFGPMMSTSEDPTA